MSKSKDLFDDSTMSFGEHLEILRMHLWKAIIGVVICVIASLFFGKHVVAFVRGPVDRALKKYNYTEAEKTEDLGFDFPAWLKSKFTGEEYPPPTPANKLTKEDRDKLPKDVIVAKMRSADVYDGLKKVAPKSVNDEARPKDDQWMEVRLKSDEFAGFKAAVDKQSSPVSLNVQEAFLIYLKVAMVAGFVVASPWVFYQLWLFVAAGLYPHEKKYVYIYLPFSLCLFLGGALFCFYLVFPFILDFLFGFNERFGGSPPDPTLGVDLVRHHVTDDVRDQFPVAAGDAVPGAIVDLLGRRLPRETADGDPGDRRNLDAAHTSRPDEHADDDGTSRRAVMNWASCCVVCGRQRRARLKRHPPDVCRFRSRGARRR